MLVVVLVVPAFLGRGRDVEPFDRSAVDQFEAAAPEIVFLGNSLLDTRIDPEHLAGLTGLRTASLAVVGTGPGIWYLQLKNVIGGGSHRPRTVFVFFHDDLITRPISFTGASDRSLLERLSHTDAGVKEAELERASGVGGRIGRAFSAIYPLAESSPSSRGPVESAGAFITGMDRDEASVEADRVFAFANRRDQDRNIQQPKFHGAFAAAVENSFLPQLVEQARELAIDLVVVRVSARPKDNGVPNEPDNLAEYSDDLASYLVASGTRYIDMTGHPGIDAGMYYDGYHLKHRFRTHYTEFFGEWLLSGGGAGP
jgi:hypothetical protein